MTTVLESLNQALHALMVADERVYLIGEDLLDPYGGAFKVSRGLSTGFPERVLTTPISEAGLTGLAAGMALRGMHPIVEIMFGDFVTLIADQVINHIAKFHWMYNDQVEVPLVIRTPMGGRRGYGPTHSQTLEKIFLGVPGLRVLAPTALGDPGDLLHLAVKDSSPVLFIENKLLYLQTLFEPQAQVEFDWQALPAEPGPLEAPTYRLRLAGAPAPQLTLAAYGYMAELARTALQRMAYEHEIFGELIVPTQLAPFELDDLFSASGQTGRLLVIEEAPLSLGWGAEVTARAAERLGPRLQAVRRVAGLDLPIPASAHLEAMVLPGVDNILQAALDLVGNQPPAA